MQHGFCQSVYSTSFQCLRGTLSRSTGGYETYYDRETQQKLLNRPRVDLSRVAARNFTEPLAPYEKVFIARAASFFYLTGTGAETRSVVLGGVGPREIDFRIQELVVQVDRFFRPEERSHN